MKIGKLAYEQYERVNALNNVPESRDWIDRHNEQTDIYNEIKEVSQSLKGLCAGKLLQFSVGDGHALYVVVKLDKNWAHVVHLDYMDGYRDLSVINGKVDRRVAERIVKFEELTEELFS